MNNQQIVSAKIKDPKLWEDFKSICATKGVKMAYELENIIKDYVEKQKK